MCEPATLTAIGTFFASSAGAAGTAAAAGAATTAATALTTAQTVSLALTAASAITAGVGAYQQSRAAKATAEANAATADMAAKDALQRGEKDAQDAMRQSRSLVGQQRAAFSARGLDISSGTPADVIEQTDFFGQSDAATARTNARKEAYGYKARGAGYQAEARSQNPGMAVTGSLLGGASSVADKWYMFSKG